MLLRNRRSLAAVVAFVLLAVVVLPALFAYRYTAPEQRGDFLRRPWRAWAFAYAALAVPADSELKTSGMALRKGEWLFRGTVIDPQEVQLVFTSQNVPYTFAHDIGTRQVTSTVTPSYRFIWQVRGEVDTLPGAAPTVVALLDYKTGRVLYDVRDDLRPAELSPSPAASPSNLP
jgi:hypothetical protein